MTDRSRGISNIHLSPRFYTSLQDYVHQGHKKTFDLLRGLLDLRHGETVVEIGCGTGMIASHFVAHGYDYWGLDLDSERVASAKRRVPGANFLVHDALAIEEAPLPPVRRVFIHGVLHHLEDSYCRKIIDHILSLGPEIALAVIEPYSPRPWWSNPMGALLARLDEGKHVRALEAWLDLLGPHLDVFTTRSIWPRWPVEFIDARLTPK